MREILVVLVVDSQIVDFPAVATPKLESLGFWNNE